MDDLNFRQVMQATIVHSALFYAALIGFLFAVALLPGCAVSPETREVHIPVALRPAPPPELTAPIQAELPVFVAPSDPAATSGLTAEGERRLKTLLHELLARTRAWQAWGTTTTSTTTEAATDGR